MFVKAPLMINDNPNIVIGDREIKWNTQLHADILCKKKRESNKNFSQSISPLFAILKNLLTGWYNPYPYTKNLQAVLEGKTCLFWRKKSRAM